jgi:hypothetical protein
MIGPGTGSAGNGGSSGGSSGGASGGSNGSAGAAFAGAGGDPSCGASGGATETGFAGSAGGGGGSGGGNGQGFTCTLVAGDLVTGEWFNAGFENDGVDGSTWEGKFQHYGFIDIWAQDPPAGFAWTAPITSPCATNATDPDRVIFTAWSWDITDESTFIADVLQDIMEFKKNFLHIKRFELSTIVRCPMNVHCNPDAPVPATVGTDHNMGLQDCYVAPYIDDALAMVAAMFPDFVHVAPKFESPSCECPIAGAHLYHENTAIAKTIATYYISNP